MKKATVLITDGGGRGATLAKKYLQSPHIGKVIAVPGNDLMKLDKNLETFPDLKTTSVDEIINICQKEKVDLVDVAQDDAVATGVTNRLQKLKINCIGPTKEAGRIEWDKAWAREFMKNNNLPIPHYTICSSEQEGEKFIKKSPNSKWFVKANGLVAGKGALFAKDNQDALKKIKAMKNFGDAGKTYLIEECLEGEEFSSFAFVDGEDFKIVGHAQDHKTVFDGNLGPNTGGMGCSSPPLAVTKEIKKQIEEIFAKTAKGLSGQKTPYKGILYLGGIINPKGKVFIIEFNSRWGDPEAQVIIPAIKGDLYEISKNVAQGKLKNTSVAVDQKYRLAVAYTTRGYPDNYSQVVGKEIFGLGKLLNSKEVTVFGAGTKSKNNKFFASGGRLFYVMAEGKNILDVRNKVYNALSFSYIEGNLGHFRTDIGYRDLARFYNTEQAYGL